MDEWPFFRATPSGVAPFRANVNHEQRTTSVRVPHANLPIIRPSRDPQRARRRIGKGHQGIHITSVPLGLRLDRRRRVPDSHVSRSAHEPRLARRQVREGCQSHHQVRMPLEYDQCLAASDRVEDANLLVV